MHEAPLELIEDLASKEAQTQWMINAPVDERVSAREMLSDGHRFCDIVCASAGPTTARQRDAVRALLSAIEGAGNLPARYTHANIAQLIDGDSDWELIRRRAGDVIKAFAPLPYD